MKKALGWLKKNKKRILIADAVLIIAASVFVFAVEKPESTKGLQVAGSTYSTAELSWEKNDSAKGYRIYRSEDGRHYEYLDSTAKTNYTDKDLKTGTSYYYKVTSRNGLKTSEIRKERPAEVTPELETPKLNVVTSTGKMTLNYSRVDGALGYQILRDGKVVGEAIGTTYVDQAAKGDQKYRYQVKAFRYAKDPVYSASSNAVKAVMHAVQNFHIDNLGKDLLIEWNRSEHYSTFKLYNGDKVIAETQGNSYTLSDYKLDKVYDIKLVGISEDGETVSPETEKRFKVVEAPMTNEDARQAACDWGVKIAADNSFTYGTGRRSHNFGCYFCGTNVGPVKNKKGKSLVNGHSYAKTYCCNPFVTACYAHGAGDPNVLKGCQRGTGFDFSVKTFTRFGHWQKVGKPAYSSLQKGDVLLWTSHMMLYIGDGKIVHAKTEGWGAGSICIDSAASYYKRTKYVMRYTGTGSGTKIVIKDVDEDGNIIGEDTEETKE